MLSLLTVSTLIPYAFTSPTPHSSDSRIQSRSTPSEEACQGKSGHLVCLSTTQYTICNPDWPSVMDTQPGVICQDGNFINVLGSGPSWSVDPYSSLLESKPTWSVDNKAALNSLLDARPTWTVADSPAYESLVGAGPTWTVEYASPQAAPGPIAQDDEEGRLGIYLGGGSSASGFGPD